MKLVLEIVPHDGDDVVVHRVVENFPVTLGRGFHNDIIVTDPHVSPQHLRIDYASGKWIITDLDSHNGTILNHGRLSSDSLPVKSGDTLHIGQTVVRFYAPHHPVAETVRVQQLHIFFTWLAHRRTAWAALVLAVLTAMGSAYLEIWSQEPGMIVAIAAGTAAGTILVWATLWSVAGRLIHRRPHFTSHVSVISLYLCAGVIAWYINSYADFLAGGGWPAAVIGSGLTLALLLFLFYTSFSLVSRMARQKKIFAAAFLSTSIVGGSLILGIIGTKDFIPLPVYTSTLEPYLAWLAPGDTVGEFMQSNQDLLAEFTKTGPAT